ncbi:NUDIX hydrolase [Nocardiopsis kunsanensis]|uniref:Nudix hydrolase domain-containing protein n=1 Tax=Nocardiopsis kunsanensis TaxID=141693 RepID=A0A918XDU3_9ACTN|nr:NUDIX domain-containing protein [Nocardiopsis kunsanensis]GHD26405.1 hypothetical protein GCM10007147_24330 [Nocardiopsis kunsanensis]
MTKTESTRTTAAALIRRYDGAIFLQRRRMDAVNLAGAWDVVGGKVDPGETVLEALERETREETGWELTAVISDLGHHEFRLHGSTWTEYCYLVEVRGELEFPQLEMDKYSEFQWFATFDAIRRVQGDNCALGYGEYISRLVSLALTESQKVGL